MIEIKNLRGLDKYWKKNPWDMRCDRQSPVGNPYIIGRDGNRDMVCNLFEKDFERQMENPFFRAYIESLERIWKRHHQIDAILLVRTEKMSWRNH